MSEPSFPSGHRNFARTFEAGAGSPFAIAASHCFSFPNLKRSTREARVRISRARPCPNPYQDPCIPLELCEMTSRSGSRPIHHGTVPCSSGALKLAASGRDQNIFHDRPFSSAAVRFESRSISIISQGATERFCFSSERSRLLRRIVGDSCRASPDDTPSMSEDAKLIGRNIPDNTYAATRIFNQISLLTLATPDPISCHRD